MARDFFSEQFADLKLDNKIIRADEEVHWILEQAGPVGRALDVGCGRGRISLALARNQVQVTAIDTNAAYLDVARSRQGDLTGIEWRLCDASTLTEVDHYDLVVSMFSSFGYDSDQKNEEVLRTIQKAMRVGATLVLEITNRDAEHMLQPHVEVEHRGDLTIFKEYSFDAIVSRRTMRFTYIAGDHVVERGSLDMRLYSMHEIVALTARAGLTIKGIFENARGDVFDISGPHLTVLARKDQP